MSEVNRIKVIIDESVYELSSAESPEYIQSVAAYIDKKIKSIYSVKSGGAMNPRLKTFFISLNIADDLFKERQENEKLKKNIKELEKIQDQSSDDVVKLDEENIELRAKIELLQDELTRARNELEEYMAAFELQEDLDKEAKVARLKR